MNVQILECTDCPLDLISICAGVSYGKPYADKNRAKKCFDNGHLSVFEHAKVTFLIDDISRDCANQLVRHRHGSYTQQSQRYCKVDTEDAWYEVPLSFMGDFDAYHKSMKDCADAYNEAINSGVPVEDARYLLPGSAYTSIAVTFNLRSFYEFLKLRLDDHAQWEIRNLAFDMLNEFQRYSSQQNEIAEWFITSLGVSDER